MPPQIASNLILRLSSRKWPEISREVVHNRNQQESRKLLVAHFWLPGLKSLNQSDFLKIN